MTRITKEEWAVIVIILVVIALPIGAIMVFATPEPFHVITGDIISDAANNAGLMVVSSTNGTLMFQGATAGKSYTVADREGHLSLLYVQAFDSEESRNSAIRLYNAHSVAKGKPPGDLIIVGDTLVYIPASSASIKQWILPGITLHKLGNI
ncbi:MAG: hypothetical protein STSR0009_30650 [Methanoregula sp.]